MKALIQFTIFVAMAWWTVNTFAPDAQLSPTGITDIAQASKNRLAASNLEPINFSSFQSLLADEQRRPAMVLFYASWCPHCKKQIKTFHRMEQQYGNHVDFIRISLDKSPGDLSDYLDSIPDEREFTPYYLSPDDSSSFFASASNRYRVTTDGRIPHIVVFDDNNRNVYEHFGYQNQKLLQRVIRSVTD